MEDFNDYKRKNDHDIELIKSVLFGNPEIGEIGMKKTLDELYAIIKNASQQDKGVEKMMERIKGGLKWIGVIALTITILMGWWIGILTAIAHYLTNE